MTDRSIIFFTIFLTLFNLTIFTQQKAVAQEFSCTTSSQCINVKDHGAKGDGKTDDTNAIDKAQNAIHSTGGTLYFPAGTYPLSGTGITIKKSNITFKGAGAYT